MKKLFKLVYPDKDLSFGILLQCFLTVLVPPISWQILLCRQSTTFKQAVENTKEVEYALNFETKPTKPATKDIDVINKMQPMEAPKLAILLQQALDQMTKMLEDLKTRLQLTGVDQTARDCNPPRNCEATTVQSML